MNQIANRNAFALPEFNSHVTLFDYNVRAPHSLAATEYRRKARRARMRMAAYVQPVQIEQPKPKPSGLGYMQSDQQKKKRSEIINELIIERGKESIKETTRRFKRHNELIMQYNEVNQVANTVDINRLTVREIQLFVLSQNWKFGSRSVEVGDCTHSQLMSTRRTYNIMPFRQIGMFLAKILTTRSFPDIGGDFGGKDHTTVLHACRQVEKSIAAGKLLINGKKFDLELLEIKL